MNSKRKLIFAVLAGIIACGGGTDGQGTGVVAPPPPNGLTVAATPALAFGPDTLHVHPGDAVTFAFGAVAHNVFFNAGQAGSPADISGTNQNTSITRVFGSQGSFDYQCHIHPSMTGTIIVE